jgi:hypothetical protein
VGVSRRRPSARGDAAVRPAGLLDPARRRTHHGRARPKPRGVLQVAVEDDEIVLEYLDPTRGIDVELKSRGADEPETQHVERGEPLPGLVGTTSDGSDYGGPVYIYREARFQVVPVIPNLEPTDPS